MRGRRAGFKHSAEIKPSLEKGEGNWGGRWERKGKKERDKRMKGGGR